MRLPTQELKPNEERKRRRRTAPTINGILINGDADGDADEVMTLRQEKVANFSHHKRVADYLLGRSVGEGSFAKVRLGLHVQTAEEVAIKVISKARARKDAYVHKNLRREGRILQMSRHKNIVQVYDILETDNNYYLVTEFCRGGELIDIVTDKGCLQENDVRRYVAQLVSAVSHLHEHGIVHRDLKVENLLLDDRGEIKIIDFGLSNVISATCSDPTRALATQCGSPAYAAPELLAKNMYGPKVDVWSIGVITYALLVGKLPFTVEPFRIPKLCRKMMLGDMNPIPSHLSGNCRHFIRRLLVPDPEIRPSISQVMKMPWIGVVGKTPKISAYGKPGIRVEEIYSSTDINSEVVREMTSKLDFEFSNVINCVRKNRPGEALATYYLLLKQKSQLTNSKDRRHNDVIGSDGNLDHENESDKSSDDEEGLNDVDDVTNDVVFNGSFNKKEAMFKAPSHKRNGVKENGRTDMTYCNKTIVDKLIEKHIQENPTKDPQSSLKHHENNCPKTPSTTNGNSLNRIAATPSSSRKSSHRKSNGDIDRTLERLEHVQKRFENHFQANGKPCAEKNAKRDQEITETEYSSKEEKPEKLPELESASGTKSGKSERKSRGPNSMRELMKTMSRAKDALQRRSIFGQGKYARGEEKKATGSPELNKFRRLLSKNSNDSSSDRRPPSPTKPGDTQNPRLEEKLWRNYASNGGSYPARIKLPEASPPTTPLTIKERTDNPNRASMPSTGYPTNPRSPRTAAFYAGRPSLPQRISGYNNRSSFDGVATTPELVHRHLPRIDKNDSIFTNPLGYEHLTTRYHFPSPPRTPSSRETCGSGATTSGVKEIIEKFHSLMNNAEPNPQSHAPMRESYQTHSPRSHDAGTALSYLSAHRRQREDSFSKKAPKTQLPNGKHALRLTSNDEGNYITPPVKDYVIRQNGETFASHFGSDQDAISREKQSTPSASPKYRTPSRGIWYKSAV